MAIAQKIRSLAGITRSKAATTAEPNHPSDVAIAIVQLQAAVVQLRAGAVTPANLFQTSATAAATVKAHNDSL